MLTGCLRLGLDLFSPFCQITVIVLNGRYGELIHIRRISMPPKRSVHFVKTRGDVRGDKCCSFPLTWGSASPAQRHTAPSGLLMEIIYFQQFKQRSFKVIYPDLQWRGSIKAPGSVVNMMSVFIARWVLTLRGILGHLPYLSTKLHSAYMMFNLDLNTQACKTATISDLVLWRAFFYLIGHFVD